MGAKVKMTFSIFLSKKMAKQQVEMILFPYDREEQNSWSKILGSRQDFC